MGRPDWGELSRKFGPQVAPVKPGDLAPPVVEPGCSRCGKRRKVGRVTRDAILCAVCVAVLRDLGQLDDDGGDDA
jgi:hypothetical protein